MAKYMRRADLVATTFAFKVFGKRRCDFSEAEMKEYNRLQKQISRGTITLEELIDGKTQEQRQRVNA